MSARTSAKQVSFISLLALALSGCFNPPYNNFHKDHRAVKQTAVDAAAGAGLGAIVGTIVGNTGAGALIGGVAGAAVGLSKNTKKALLKELQKQDIQLVVYGDNFTLIVPTDRYYIFNSPRLNDVCYPGLINIVKLLKFYPDTPIYVAGFTDNVGARSRKNRLSQAQAETMLTFLWANDIRAQRLHAEGYGDKHDIGDNHLIHGSAYNRRIEIQWHKDKEPHASSLIRIS